VFVVIDIMAGGVVEILKDTLTVPRLPNPGTQIYFGIWDETEVNVQVVIPGGDATKIAKECKRELRIWRKLRCDSILPLLGVAKDPENVWYFVTSRRNRKWFFAFF